MTLVSSIFNSLHKFKTKKIILIAFHIASKDFKYENEIKESLYYMYVRLCKTKKEIWWMTEKYMNIEIATL